MLNPGNKFHALKGDRMGQFAISINKQWRVCFEWHEGNAFTIVSKPEWAAKSWATRGVA